MVLPDVGTPMRSYPTRHWTLGLFSLRFRRSKMRGRFLARCRCSRTTLRRFHWLASFQVLHEDRPAGRCRVSVRGRVRWVLRAPGASVSGACSSGRVGKLAVYSLRSRQRRVRRQQGPSGRLGRAISRPQALAPAPSPSAGSALLGPTRSGPGRRGSAATSTKARGRPTS